jgi:hypothetical protein
VERGTPGHGKHTKPRARGSVAVLAQNW